MSGKFKKHKGNNKQAWLDWLADDPPAPEAGAELRQRFKQQANSYQPRNRAAAPGPQTQHQTTVAAPQPVPQAPAVPNTAPAAHQAHMAPVPAAPATVSIQIHIPAIHTERFKRGIAKIKRSIAQLRAWIVQGWEWLLGQFATNRKRTISIAAGVVVVLVLLIVPPLFNFGSKPKQGSASGGSAGGVAKPKKPNYDVVHPSTKPQLANPDGVHAAYDSKRESYSFRDYIGQNGFIVSQQPVPAKFQDGAAAVSAIAPTLNQDVKPEALKTLFGTAYVSTNPKYGSQSVVFSIRNLLLFIQSAHAFTDEEWTNYINALQ